eukprot:846707_1
MANKSLTQSFSSNSVSQSTALRLWSEIKTVSIPWHKHFTPAQIKVILAVASESSSTMACSWRSIETLISVAMGLAQIGLSEKYSQRNGSFTLDIRMPSRRKSKMIGWMKKCLVILDERLDDLNGVRIANYKGGSGVLEDYSHRFEEGKDNESDRQQLTMDVDVVEDSQPNQGMEIEQHVLAQTCADKKLQITSIISSDKVRVEGISASSEEWVEYNMKVAKEVYDNAESDQFVERGLNKSYPYVQSRDTSKDMSVILKNGGRQMRMDVTSIEVYQVNGNGNEGAIIRFNF